MSINNTVVLIYRRLAFSVLAMFFVGVVSYVSLVAFYLASSSWAAPLVLGPSQDRVLAFQPEIAIIEATIDKQRVELETALSTKRIVTEQVVQVSKLIGKVGAAMSSESAQLQRMSEAASTLALAKRADTNKQAATTAEARELLKQLDQELTAKLITSDQAAQRRIALTAAFNAVTDGNISALQLETQAQQAATSAQTFNGGSTSVAAISAVKQAVELKTILAQLQIQAVTAESSADALQRSIAGAERVLEVAKSSPYYRALREEVTVAFVPYDNLDDVKVGDKVYDCYLQVILCRHVGSVKTLYEAEEHAKHPLFKTDLRGKLVELQLTDPSSSKSQVVFIGGKPLFL